MRSRFTLAAASIASILLVGTYLAGGGRIHGRVEKPVGATVDEPALEPRGRPPGPGTDRSDLLALESESTRTALVDDVLALRITGDDGSHATAHFLIADGRVEQRTAPARGVVPCPAGWTDVVVSLRSGVRIFRTRASLTADAGGVHELHATVEKVTLSLSPKSRIVEGLEPAISSVQAAPAPPDRLRTASHWSTGSACRLLGPRQLELALDREATQVRLRVEHPFALGTQEVPPDTALLVARSEFQEPLELWWPCPIRFRLKLAGSSSAPRSFRARWAFFDLSGGRLHGEGGRLEPGTTRTIAAPIGSASVRLDVYDGGSAPAASVQGAIVRRAQIFEIDLDRRIATFVVVNDRGAPVPSAILRSGGVDRATTDDDGTARIRRHAVTAYGVTVRHPAHDTVVVSAEEVEASITSGLPHRVTLSVPTVLRFRVAGDDVPPSFAVGLRSADLLIGGLEEEFDMPDMEGLVFQDEDTTYFFSDEQSPRVLEVRGIFAPRAFSAGTRVVLCDAHLRVLRSEFVVPRRGQVVEVAVGPGVFGDTPERATEASRSGSHPDRAH
ncbi:MAG: carboxypeptidase-like regulatory domain-containing protein [Planctomycetota bacterium]